MNRALAVVTALLAIGFFALAAWQASGSTGAAERLDRGAPAPRTAELLERAGTLNPDAGVDVLRARLALQERRLDDARALLLDVTRREPEGLDAWAVLALAFTEADPALAASANAALQRLMPPVPEP